MPRRDAPLFKRLTTSLGFFLLIPVGAATADQPPDYHLQMTVENVQLTPTVKGGWSALSFRIVNESRDDLQLLGVETSVAATSQIIARIDYDKTRVMGSVGVPAHGVLDLTTSHLKIEMGPLNRELKTGQSIPVNLVFVEGGRVGVSAHVHEDD